VQPGDLNMGYRNFAIAAIFLAATFMDAQAQTTVRRGPVVRQVDRVLIESGDPAALFSFFTDALQLPVASPLAHQQGFVSGGLWAGNVIFEIYRYGGQKQSPKRRAAEAHYAALAFEPYPLAVALPELQIRGIPNDPPETYQATLPNGSQGVSWTTVALPSFSSSGLSIFLYEYNPAFLKVDVRRKQLGNRLTLNGGGTLGLKSTGEIVLAVTNLERARSEWKRLLGNPNPGGSWSMSAGPAIRLVQGSANRIQKLVLKVESLDRAQVTLKRLQLTGSSSVQGISLNPARIQGLSILLVEK
jgi:hypothetical protein